MILYGCLSFQPTDFLCTSHVKKKERERENTQTYLVSKGIRWQENQYQTYVQFLSNISVQCLVFMRSWCRKSVQFLTVGEDGWKREGEGTESRFIRGHSSGRAVSPSAHSFRPVRFHPPKKYRERSLWKWEEYVVSASLEKQVDTGDRQQIEYSLLRHFWRAHRTWHCSEISESSWQLNHEEWLICA